MEAGVGAGSLGAGRGAAGTGAGAGGSGPRTGAGAGQQRPWTQFLVDRLKAVESVRAVLHAVLSSEAVVGSEGQGVQTAAREVLPAALDVLEVLAAGARRGEVASALLAHAQARARHGGGTAGVDRQTALPQLFPGLPLDSRVRGLLRQHGREQLVAALDGLLQDGKEGRGAGEGMWGYEEREEVARRLVGGRCNVFGCYSRVTRMGRAGWCCHSGVPTAGAASCAGRRSRGGRGSGYAGAVGR